MLLFYTIPLEKEEDKTKMELIYNKYHKLMLGRAWQMLREQMAAIGMPDIQYHFHILNPDELKNHALNVAFYMYENNSPVKSGDMIDGLEDGHMSQAVQWTCQYEESIAEPRRSVLDIAPGAYAAGR